MAEREETPGEDQGQNRHYDIICLTLTTIGGATLAAVMLLSDAPKLLQGMLETPSSWSQWIGILLATLAAGAYAVMTVAVRTAILQRPKPGLSLTEEKRRLTSWVFNTLIGIAVALVLVIAANLISVLADTISNADAKTQEQGSPDNTPDPYRQK